MRNPWRIGPRGLSSGRAALSVMALVPLTAALLPKVGLADSGQVTFTAAIPPSLASGYWELSTTAGAASVLLQAGQLGPSSTQLTVTVPSTAAAVPGGDGQFILHVVKPIDSSSGVAGGYVTGLSPAEIASGIVVDASLHIDQVPLMSVAEAMGSTGGSAPTGTPMQSFSITAGTARVPALPGEGGSAPAATASTDSTSSLPVQPCASTNSCGSASTAAVGSCSSTSLFSEDCVVDQRSISGVTTFRGYSAQVAGSDNTFDVQNQNSDQMTEGYRASAGGFSVSGSDSVANTMGFDDQWPTRGSCWVGYPSDPNGCDNDGSRSTFGQDTWTWEKHAHIFLGATASTYEILYDSSYDGGTGWGNDDTSNYYKDPAKIKANAYGHWGEYQPGSITTTYLQRTSAYSNAAGVSVSFPDAYSSATFESSETYQTYQKVTNRDALQHYAWMGPFYRYDNGQSTWQASFWSCELAVGYTTTSGNPCWASGT
jgi:hypothetical protein